jgi:SAM-dependent methyltransferase
LPPREASEFAPGEVVISSSAIEYLDSIEEALRFVRSILLPKGLFIFSVSNRDSISRRIVRIVYRLTGRPEYFGLVRHFLNEKDFRSVLCNSGFEYVDHLYFGGRDRLNAALSMLFPVRMSTNMVLIIAQRQA